jgi:hypothetical protein
MDISNMTTEEKDDFLKNITVWMINQVQSGEATPSLINCIRQYLKDNGVHSSIKHDNQMQDLVSILPFKDDEEEEVANG